MSLGEVEDVSTEIGDVIVIGGQNAGPPINVQGNAPGGIPSSWWPWIIAGGVAVTLWWLTKDERNRPLGRAGR